MRFLGIAKRTQNSNNKKVLKGNIKVTSKIILIEQYKTASRFELFSPVNFDFLW